MATDHMRVPVKIKERAKEVKVEHDYPTLGEALRHMCREGDYNV